MKFIRLAGWFPFVLVSETFLFGQRIVTHTNKESLPAYIGVRGGLTQLYSDLHESTPSVFAGLGLQIPLSLSSSIGLEVSKGILRAHQSDYYHSRSKAPFTQIALIGSINLLQFLRKPPRRVELRFLGGIGLLFFRAEAVDLTTGALQRLTNNKASYRTRDGVHTRGKPGIKNTHELVLPIGLRMATALSRRISIGGDICFNFVRTDKLDATLDKNNLTLTTGRAQTEGNHYKTNSYDSWGYLAVGLTWYFADYFK